MADHTSILYPEIDPELEHWFQEQADTWIEETGHLSNPAQIARHDSYLAIIGKGQKILPLILKALQDEENHWYVALRLLTGASPVPPEASGKPDQVREAWLQWGRTNGYLK
jgi:hypothetical protein